MKVFFYTLGCKVNQYETESMTELFKQKGYEITSSSEQADIFIVNSCTVTSVSDQKSRQAVRRFKRNHPDGLVVLTGCMPQAYPEQATALTEADIVVGNRDHRAVLSKVEDYLSSAEKVRILDIVPHQKSDTFENIPIDAFRGRTRAFLKIQDGCNRYCTYCIIPTARGRSRSRTPEDLQKELQKMKEAGFRELVLVGINFCCYGIDLGTTFTDPVKIACSYGFDRVRIGSLEFDNITEEAVDRLAGLPNFCPQFHMSLQSGCDATLKRMHRHYTTAEYEALCNKLRAVFPDCTITTDIMVGFPGETEEEFEASLAFAKKIGFEKIHVFPYSPRKGTVAAELPDQVPKAVKTERAKRMGELAKEIRKSYLESRIGNTVTVLCEQYKNGFVTGYTENYTPVRFPSSAPLHNHMVTVVLTGIDLEHDCCVGTLVEDLG